MASILLNRGGENTKIGIIIYSNDAETVWNAFRFGNFSLNYGDEVQVFLLGKGVECESLDTDKFKVTDQMRTLIDKGGKIFEGKGTITVGTERYEVKPNHVVFAPQGGVRCIAPRTRMSLVGIQEPH